MVNIIDANGNEKPGGGPQTAKAMPTNPTNTGLSATNVDDSLKELNSNLSIKKADYMTTQDIAINVNGFANVASITDFGLTVNDVPRVKGVFIYNVANGQSLVVPMMPTNGGTFTVIGTPNSTVKAQFGLRISYA